MLTQEQLISLLEETDALKRGHFRLTSGMHSEQYVQCALLLRFPDKAEIVARDLASRYAEEKIDLVVGPAIGGIVIAHEVARALGVPAIFAERENGAMSLRRGFTVAPGQRVLVVEDVITTGGSTQEVADLIASLGGNVVGAASIIDRSSPETLKIQVPFKSLLKLSIPTYQEADCPMCKTGSVAYKPGSRT